jgi:gamma-glutamyltranspeptidase / glutathione hydrolase
MVQGDAAMNLRAAVCVVLAATGCRGSGAGVVSSASPEATQAGIEILNAGGNAIDAAAAVGFALAVTEPAMSGLGAGMQMIVQAPGHAAFVINGTSFAPAATPTSVKNADSTLKGHRASTIPTTVATLDHAVRTHGSGSISWEQAIAPAIRYAEQGFRVGAFRARVFARHQRDLSASPSARQLFLKPDGSVPAEGDTLRQPVLGRMRRDIL